MPLHAPALLVLEDGRTFRGEAYGAEGETFGEAVFATGMTGYQETLTDPSYHRQVVVMTAPHIGNTGLNDEDPESSRIWVAGYVVRDPARVPSSWRSRRSLDDALREQGVVGISRHRHPRPDPPPARARRDAGRHLHDRERRRSPARAGPRRPGEMTGANLSDEVSTSRAVRRTGRRREAVHRRRARPRDQGEHTADDGRARHRDPRPARDLHARRRAGRRRPTGSSSPTGPATRPRPPRRSSCSAGRSERGLPYFGICFGNQLFGRALGFDTYKLTYGHRGINQPVMDRTTGKVEVTAHNHGFAVEAPLDAVDRDAVRRGDRLPRLPQRRRGRGSGAATRRAAGRLLGPVPPRGRRRSARRGLPLRPVLPT